MANRTRFQFPLSLCLLMLAVLFAPSPTEAQEFRAFWADAWGNGFKTPAQTSQLVDFAAKYGFTAVFIQVRKRGDACYSSSIEPEDLKTAKDYDPLADVIEKAHRKGIQVHAWVMLYDAWVESKSLKLAPGHVCAKHPDWISEDIKGGKTYVQGRMYLDPGIPEVRAYLTEVVLDITRRYPIDGIHLDGLRYPDSGFGYNPKSVAAFNSAHNRQGIPDPNDPEWGSWRREQVTILAHELPKAIRKVRPKAKVSLAAYWNQQEIQDRFFQDWPAWLKAGYFDFVVPMVFVPKDVKDFISMVDAEMACGDGSNIYIGQGTWRYPIETTNRHLRVMRARNVPGYVLFDYTALRKPSKDGKSVAADQLLLTESATLLLPAPRLTDSLSAATFVDGD